MTGHEAVSCTVTAPNGTVHAVPVILADGGGHFQATLHWMQVGVHKVRQPFAFAESQNGIPNVFSS